MKGYLSIGKVAKLKNVSIKSLRYYDEIGIFKPALTDHTTGYRYYKESQLYLLDAISLCIELGIPLKSMSDYCDKNGKPDLQKLLGNAKAMAEQKIRSMYAALETLQNTGKGHPHNKGRIIRLSLLLYLSCLLFLFFFYMTKSRCKSNKIIAKIRHSREEIIIIDVI